MLGGKTAGAQVLVVGSYHMSNPGLDAMNIRRTTCSRQSGRREIEQLASKLARFRPTKVAVEIPFGRDSTSNSLYRRYLQGAHALDRTEMQQLGFRIARLAGPAPHSTAIDYALDVNVAGVMVWALTHGQPELATAAQSLSARLLAEADSMMRHATVTEIVAALNSARADSAHGIYMAALRVGADTSYPGATDDGPLVRAEPQDRVERPADLIERAVDRVLVHHRRGAWADSARDAGARARRDARRHARATRYGDRPA